MTNLPANGLPANPLTKFLPESESTGWQFTGYLIVYWLMIYWPDL
jgi:hypothetical protein